MEDSKNLPLQYTREGVYFNRSRTLHSLELRSIYLPMNYVIQVISREGRVILTKNEDEHPSEDQLAALAEQCGGEFCDVSRAN